MKRIISSIPELVASAKKAINQAVDAATLDNVRVEYLGKKGRLTIKMMQLRELTPEARSVAGSVINEAKKQVQQAFNARKANIEKTALHASLATEKIDVSLPGRRMENGGLHPITITIDRIERLFSELGFTVVTGPEIEDYYHNFDALNFPSNHPARTDQDTFWFDTIRLLRTQTSCLQIRTMEHQQPPIRIIAPGRVYRNDNDQTHTPMFHQIEGFILDKNISFSNLKGTLHDFLRNFFEENVQIRFRPSYFPFTEPSGEVEVMWKNLKWLEIMGCGMIHPNILINLKIDPEVYSGFAFGIGIERMTMLRYGVTDMRAFFENDLRFLKQFK